MAFIELDESNFEATLSAPGAVVVECWASWCGSCDSFEPIFDAVAFRHPDVTFAKLDTGGRPRLCDAVGVTQVPTVLVYREGLLLLRHPGSVDEPTLESMVTQAVALDMSAVRAEMEREESGAIAATGS